MIARKSFVYIAGLALLLVAGSLIVSSSSVSAWSNDDDHSYTRSERKVRSSKKERKESNRSYEHISYEVREDEKDEKDYSYKDKKRKLQEYDDDVKVSVRGADHVKVLYSSDCCCCDGSYSDCGDHDDGEVLGDDDDKDEPSDPQDEEVLELSVDTKVKVNDGDLVDAETEDDAPVGEIGDTATWKVTVQADEIDPGEDRDVRVHWQPPANVEPISHETTAGTYDGEVWEVNIGDMPAMLTAETQIMSDGVGATNAVIAEISCDSDPSGFCSFEDFIVENNMNPASIRVLAAEEDPAGPGTVGVLGASTTGGQGGEGVLGATDSGQVLAATGVGSYTTILFGAGLVFAPLTLVRRRSQD